MANKFKVKKGLIVNGDGGTVVDIQGNSGQLFSVTDSLLGILMSVNDITGIPILQVSSDDTVRMGPYGNPFIVNAIGLSVGTNLVIDSLGNIKFDGTPTTTNQNRGIYWTAYDKEGTTDPSDAAYIRHTTNSGGLDGSVLEISAQNDANDGVNFLVNSTASGVRINGNAVLNAGNYNSYSPTLTGGGASGNWGINISGNSATTSQTTFSRVRTDGINRGSYGAISISGSENGYSGIDFTAASSTFMVNNTSGLSGIYRNNNTWLWYFDGTGALTIGTVPWARITGQPSLVTGTGASGQVSYWNGTTTQAGNNGLWWDNGNGRLGINTTSPQARLHVNGAVRIDSTSSGPEQKDPTTVKYVLTNLDNDKLMGEPDIWLQINVNGTNYVFPGYIPFGIS